MQFETPFGSAWASVGPGGALTSFGFGTGEGKCGGYSATVAAQVNEYFAGRRQDFELAMEPVGSEFQKRVWRELMTIPYGRTVSYAELAERVGRPGAARAVGRANATNPIALIVPCHRVIGSDGKLTGYAYGTELKEKLLNWEKSLAGGAPLFVLAELVQEQEQRGAYDGVN